MRDNAWLENKMWEMLHESFADVPVSNDLVIKFGRRAKQRLGSIRRKEMRKTSGMLVSRFAKSFGITPSGSPFSKEGGDNPSIITITGHFKNLRIPEYVVLVTIAHELVHYAHGFSSPLEQKYQHPHRGGVVKKELEVRGFGEIQQIADKWLKENWTKYLRGVSY